MIPEEAEQLRAENEALRQELEQVRALLEQMHALLARARLPDAPRNVEVFDRAPVPPLARAAPIRSRRRLHTPARRRSRASRATSAQPRVAMRRRHQKAPLAPPAGIDASAATVVLEQRSAASAALYT